MKYMKFIHIVLILLVCIISVATVSAANEDINVDDNQDLILNEKIIGDVYSIDDNNGLFVEENDIVCSTSNQLSTQDLEEEKQIKDNSLSSSQEEILGSDNGTFTALQNKIDNAEPGSTITLENDYFYDTGFNKTGIIISKSLTIDGNGKTINAKNQSRAFYIQSPVTLKNINFKNCNCNSSYQSGYGGAISGSGLNIITNCTFTNCIALNGRGSGWGGAIRTGTSNITSCIFTNCYSGSSGGAIDSGGNNNITNCTFINCYANSTSGGAISASKDNIIGCNFTNCHSKSGGGAIYCNDNNSISYCNFTNCYASYGGAIYCGNNNSITGCAFKGCYGSYDTGYHSGGAICCGDSMNEIKTNNIISNCTFTDCYYYRGTNNPRGGAILLGVYSGISGCTFINCSSRSSSSTDSDFSYGGAIYCKSYNNITDCTFTDCYSSSKPKSILSTFSHSGGGAIFCGNNTNITGCNFTGCYASSGSSRSSSTGGAIYANGGLTVMDCTLDNNEADLGSGIFIEQASATIQNTTFIDCGYDTDEGSVDLIDCKFLIRPVFTIEYIIDLFESTPLEIFVNEQKGFTGTININIGTKTYSVALTRGKGVKSITDLGVGTYKAVIDFQETANYTSAYAESNEFAIRYNTLFTIASIQDMFYGIPVVLNVTEKNGYDGVVTVMLGSNQYDIVLTNGNGIETIIDLGVGTYKAIIDFPQTGDYNSTHAEGNQFTIKYNTSFTIAPIPITFDGEPISLNVTEKNNYNGDVIVIIGSNTYTLTLNNGKGIKTINDLALGTYKAIIDFPQTGDYNSTYAESNEFIIKYPSFADLYDLINNAGSEPVILEYDYTYDDTFDSQYASGIPITKNIEINGNSHIIDGNGLARVFDISNGAKVEMKNINIINGNANGNGGAIVASDGTNLTICNATFANNTASGDGGAIYSEGTLYVGDSTFDNNPSQSGSGIYADEGIISNTEFINGDTISGGIEVDDCIFLTDPVFTVALIPNITVGSSINLKVSEVHGLNGTVTISINNINYSIGIIEGIGTKTITPNLGVGTYKAVLNYVGVGNFTNGTATSNNFVVSLNPIVLSSSAVTTVYNGGKYIVATLKDKNKKAISGVKVTIKINGKTYNKTTDKNGQVKLSTNGLIPKTYTTTITFAGNNKYVKATKLVKVTVKKATPKMTAKAKTFRVKVKVKNYVITLKTNKNKVMKNTKVTLKVNKKTFTAKTNKKGVATFKITNLKKKGKFTAVIRYAGNKCYNKLSKKVSITVKK